MKLAKKLQFRSLKFYPLTNFAVLIDEQQSALNIQSEFLGLFMRTLGVATAEVNDVLIRLATFERMHKAFTYKQMEQQLQSHYISQLLKQYVQMADTFAHWC